MSEDRACDRDLVQALQKAIVDGDEAEAITLVTQLTKTKTSVNIDVQDPVPAQVRERELNIKIYIEDKDTAAANYIPWKVKPSMTMLQLKRRMFDYLSFPPETQTWIVGRRIVRDQDTMSRCGITSGSSVFLYLESAASVGLDRQTFRDRYYMGENDRVLNDTSVSLHNDTDYLSLHPPTTIAGPVLPPPLPPPRKGSGNAIMPMQAEPEIFVVYPNERQSQDEAANEPVEDIYLHAPGPPVQRQDGWACPACTYINELTRPGCSMCSATRPDNYQVPENYQASEEEMLRLEREKEVENMTLQAVDAQPHPLEPLDDRQIFRITPHRHVQRCVPPEGEPVEHDEDDDGLVMVL